MQNYYGEIIRFLVKQTVDGFSYLMKTTYSG